MSDTQKKEASGLRDLFNAERYTEALELILEMGRHNPSDFSVIAGKAAILGRLGRFEECIRVLEAALALRPEDYELHHMKGAALYDLGKIPEALAAFDGCLLLKPNFHRAIELKISCLLALKSKYRPCSAIECLWCATE